MISTLFACSVAISLGQLTTPIAPPKTIPKAKPVDRVVKARPKPKKRKPAPKPVQAPPAAPVERFHFTDKPAGLGAPAKSGDVVMIHFIVKKKDGPDIADSRKRGLPYTFKIDAPGNDPLFDLVVKGMKAGGVRTATVLAKEAYGVGGAPPVILGKDTLIVTITMLRRGEK